MTLTPQFSSSKNTQNESSMEWTDKDFSFVEDTRETTRRPQMTWRKATGMNNKG